LAFWGVPFRFFFFFFFLFVFLGNLISPLPETSR